MLRSQHKLNKINQTILQYIINNVLHLDLVQNYAGIFGVKICPIFEVNSFQEQSYM